MLNYYDELYCNILEVLEEDENAKNIVQSENSVDTIIDDLVNYLIDCDDVTGNVSESYYMNSYVSRKHCYNYFRDVFEALEEYGYNKELTKFKTFVSLVEEDYLNIENMTLNEEILEELSEEDRCLVFYTLEEIDELNYEELDVITRCYKLWEVVSDVVENFLK